MVKPILEESIVELYCAMLPDCLKIADLGCSAGPNTFLVVSEIIDTIEETCQRLNHTSPPCLQAFLNDLPGNDFNTIFKSLPSFCKRLEREKGNKFGQCFVSGAPGSFYGRLFPPNSLHFVHSSYAIMWISKVRIHIHIRHMSIFCTQIWSVLSPITFQFHQFNFFFEEISSI